MIKSKTSDRTNLSFLDSYNLIGHLAKATLLGKIKWFVDDDGYTSLPVQGIGVIRVNPSGLFGRGITVSTTGGVVVKLDKQKKAYILEPIEKSEKVLPYSGHARTASALEALTKPAKKKKRRRSNKRQKSTSKKKINKK